MKAAGEVTSDVPCVVRAQILIHLLQPPLDHEIRRQGCIQLVELLQHVRTSKRLSYLRRNRGDVYNSRIN
jgi:hypothetical protein